MINYGQPVADLAWGPSAGPSSPALGCGWWAGLVVSFWLLVCPVSALGSWRGHSWAVHSMISREAGPEGLTFSPLAQRPVVCRDI